MNKITLRQVIKHVEACAALGQEACGLIVRSGKTGRGERFVPAENLLGTPVSDRLVKNTHLPSQGFLIDPKLYMQHSRDIKAIVHSHIGASSDPSPSDIQRQRATAVPWVICSVEGGKYTGHIEFGSTPNA